MASKKTNGKNLTRKGATVEQVVETVECVDLTMFTKKTEMRLGESRKGRLKKRGKYDYKFVESSVDVRNMRPWECHATLVERSWGRISANAHGVTVHQYIPSADFQNTEVLAEIIIEQAEDMCKELLLKDAKDVIAKMKSLKPEDR